VEAFAFDGTIVEVWVLLITPSSRVRSTVAMKSGTEWNVIERDGNESVAQSVSYASKIYRAPYH
jgi:hypothetical protein